jgi:hypothetical protein
MRARELFDFGACATAWRAASSCVTVRASSVSPLCPRIRSGARPPETKAGVCVSTVSHRRRVGPPGGTQSCGSAAGDGAAGPDPPGQAKRLKPIPLNSRHKAWFVLPKWEPIQLVIVIRSLLTRNSLASSRAPVLAEWTQPMPASLTVGTTHRFENGDEAAVLQHLMPNRGAQDA